MLGNAIARIILISVVWAIENGDTFFIFKYFSMRKTELATEVTS
jgi:hypothetical protein